MSHATFTFGRFNPPTEAGHGKLVDAVQKHAEQANGKHYIFASHSQDKKKNPLSHGDKTAAMRKMFKGANVVGGEHKTVIDAMKHLEKQGHKEVTMIAGSDRVAGFHKLLNDYNGKEYNFKKINVKSAGHRDPDAEGAEGMSASKLRGLVSSGKKDEFISHYSDKKLGAELHDKVKKGMQMESMSKAMFVLGGPGSGKDYVITNILNKFDLTEVQLDQILNGSVNNLIESGANLLINGNSDMDKIQLVKNTLENYTFAHTLVSVTNKISRERNQQRNKPLSESVRIRKWLDAEKFSTVLEDCFVFVNTINLSEATQTELGNFQTQIENYLQFLLDCGYVMEEKKKYSDSLKKACWKGYTAIGMKNKNGRKVPNCVPTSEAYEEGTDEARNAYAAMTPGQTVDTTPTLTTKSSKKKKVLPPDDYNSRIDGGGGYAIGGLAHEQRMSFGKFKTLKESTLSEAIDYHLNNQIPFTENIFRPGTEKFMNLMLEAKKLYAEGKYTPTDEYEIDMLEGNIGETAMYEGKKVFLDFPFEVLDEEGSDPTKGHGIGKPFRKGGGGAVYVRDGDKVRLINFSQSGMTKKYNDPARLKSFMARHNCLGNKDKTSAAYWACRWPRFFSSGGQLWW